MPISARPPADRRIIILGSLLALAVLFGAFSVDENHQINRDRYGGYTAFHAAATAVQSHQNPYSREPGRYSYVYPPLFACLLTPLLRLSMGQGARVMMALDVACMVGALLLLGSAMSRRLTGRVRADLALAVAASTGLLLAVPIHSEIHGLETNAIVLLCFAAGLFFADELPLLGGIALGFAINIKYLPLALLPYFAVRRRWTMLICTIAATCALAILPAVFVGWSTNLHYLSAALGGLTNLTNDSSAAGGAQVPALTQSTSLSATSALARLGAAHGWPKFAVPACVAIVLGFVVVLARAAYKKYELPFLKWPRERLQRAMPFRALCACEWAWLIGMILALGPNTQDRLLILVAFPGALFFTVIWTGRGYISAPLILGGIILFAAVTLPVSAMGYAVSHAWRDLGIPGLLVLAGSTLLALSALGIPTVARSKSPAIQTVVSK